jgi:hypothetical protein
MRALNRVLSLLSVVALVSVAGCGSDVASKLMCSDDATCLKASGSLYSDVDASVDQLPRCCNSVCVVMSLGCDKGFRYLTSQPGLGDCVAEPMCKLPPVQDLSMPSQTD